MSARHDIGEAGGRAASPARPADRRTPRIVEHRMCLTRLPASAEPRVPGVERTGPRCSQAGRGWCVLVELQIPAKIRPRGGVRATAGEARRPPSTFRSTSTSTPRSRTSAPPTSVSSPAAPAPVVPTDPEAHHADPRGGDESRELIESFAACFERCSAPSPRSDLLSPIEDVGWKLHIAQYLPVRLGEESRDTWLSSGQRTAIEGRSSECACSRGRHRRADPEGDGGVTVAGSRAQRRGVTGRPDPCSLMQGVAPPLRP